MRCEEVQDVLSEYLDGEIAEPWRKEWIEKHLGTCAACQAVQAELKRVREALHSLPVRPVPREVAASVAAEVEKVAGPSEATPEQEEAAAGRSILYRFLLPAGLAAAATILAFFVVLQLRNMNQEGASERPMRQELFLAKNEPADKDKAAEPAKGLAASGRAAPGRDAATAEKPRAAAAAPPATLAERMPPLVARQLAQAEAEKAKARKSQERLSARTPTAGKETAPTKTEVAVASAAPAPAEEAKPATPEVALKDLEKGVLPPTVEPANVLKGMVEKRTLLLRAQDVPSASVDVKNILSQCGAKISRDYYEGRIEGAGTRIKAEVPGRRYQVLLMELRKRNYLGPERAKTEAKAPAKSKAALPLQTIPETIDLTIKFQAN